MVVSAKEEKGTRDRGRQCPDRGKHEAKMAREGVDGKVASEQ